MTVDIERLTSHLSPSQRDEISRAYKKQEENETAAFLWCFFLGWIGAHRFYLREWGLAIIHVVLVLIMAGIIVAGVMANLNSTLVVLAALPFGLAALIWEVIDLFRIDDEVSARNLKLAETIIASAMLADTTVLQQAQTELDPVVHNVAARSSQVVEQEQSATDQAAADETTAATVTEVPIVNNFVAEEAVEASAGESATVERYETTTVTRAGDAPNADQKDEQPVQPGTRDWSETTASQLAGELAAEEPAGGSGDAEGIQMDETVTRSHTESGFSATDSVDTVISQSAAMAEDTVISADMTPMSTAEAEAPTWPNIPLVTGAALTATPMTLDYTDMGRSMPDSPVADVDGIGTAPLTVSLDDEVSPQAAMETVTADEVATIPVESYTPPVVPVVELPAADVQPPSQPPNETSEEAEPETLAELAGLATGVAGGVAAVAAIPVDPATSPIGPTEAPATAPESQVAHAEQIEHTSHLLKRIRVTRQIKVNGEVVDESSAEELIEANADPEPVRQRLRQQLHDRAAARMAELGVTEDQSNS
ncbi:MAG: TM2 domain-containing protein [Ktedonobacterales bacterium]